MSFLIQLLINKVMKNNIMLLACLLLFNANSFSQKKTTHHTKVVKYTDEQVLKYIDDYYSFYNADEEYCCPSIRKISNNVFYIKVDVCTKSFAYKDENVYEGITDPNTGETKMQIKRIKVKNDFFWHSKVLVLTIKSNGNYSVKEKSIY